MTIRLFPLLVLSLDGQVGECRHATAPVVGRYVGQSLFCGQDVWEYEYMLFSDVGSMSMFRAIHYNQ